MKHFTVEDITRILNNTDLQIIQVPTQRTRAGAFCPNCGSGDTWIIDRDQLKISPRYEMFCQSCGRWVSKCVDPEPDKESEKIDTVRKKMLQMDTYEPGERESYGIYDEAIVNMFTGKHGGVTAFELKIHFHLTPKEDDHDIVFLDHDDALMYLMIQFSLEQIESYFRQE